MADDLIVSGGEILVATGDLIALAGALGRVTSDLSEVVRLVREARSHSGFPRFDGRAMILEDHLLKVELRLEWLRQTAGQLSHDVLAAALNYADTESRVNATLSVSGAVLGWVLGRMAPVIALASIPFVLPFIVGIVSGFAFTGLSLDDTRKTFGGWLFEHRCVLSNPIVVAAIRVAVSSVDDVHAGLLGVPFPLNMVFGDEGFGITGMHTVALAVVGLGAVFGGGSATKPFTETPVVVERSRSVAVVPPRGVSDLAGRVPDPGEGGSQVRVERFGPENAPRWVVYVGGTLDFGVTPGGEPFDMTSNVSAMADMSSGSMRAVHCALDAAGAQPGEPLVAVGYSQGAIIAAQLAEQASYDVRAVVTLGGPTAQIPVPTGVPVLDIVHTDDLVPALGGLPTAREPHDDERLVVRRQILVADALPDGIALPAHRLSGYQETAALVSQSKDLRLNHFEKVIRQYGGDEYGMGTEYRANRVSAAGGG